MNGSKSLFKGMAAGLAAGTAFGATGWMLSGINCTKKLRLKRRTEKAIRALRDVMECITEFWR